MTSNSDASIAANGLSKKAADWARASAHPADRGDNLFRANAIAESARRVRLIGCSVAHLQLLEHLQRAAQTDAEVLLFGETGVGKELYARFVHECSTRAASTFVAINCGAIPDALFENEMFGHSVGAYTDACERSEGLVTAAEGGTLFFDEVDALTGAAQVKLLRLLQEKEYRRLGETRLRRANIRVISATNTDPDWAIRDGHLREDLYYRLNVISHRVPPLRERPEDVLLLAAEFSNRYSEEYGRRQTIQFTEDAQRLLAAYHWPGNTRQLENVIRGLVCQHPEDWVDAESIPVVQPHESVRAYVGQHMDVLAGLSFCDAKRHLVDHFAREYLGKMLERTGGNISRAAKLAGKDRRAFFELMRKYDIDPEEFKQLNPEKADNESLRKRKPR